MTTLLATDIGYAVGGRRILDGVSLEALGGEIVAVTGPSGSGKSSLLAILAGLEPAHQGSVRLGDEPVSPSRTDLRRRFGIVLQGYGLVSLLTAAENVELVLQYRSLDRDEVRDRALNALERVDLADAADQLVEELSGGQQQRVAVARALVGVPDVLVADEPTAELDADNRDRVVSLLLEQSRRGAVVVVATHDPDVAAQCDRTLALVDGRPAQPGLEAAEPVSSGGDAMWRRPNP